MEFISKEVKIAFDPVISIQAVKSEQVQRGQIPLLIQRNSTGTDIHLLLLTKEGLWLHSRLPGQENPVLFVKENIISTTATIF